jgi:hypothetical protein
MEQERWPPANWADRRSMWALDATAAMGSDLNIPPSRSAAFELKRGKWRAARWHSHRGNGVLLREHPHATRWKKSPRRRNGRDETECPACLPAPLQIPLFNLVLCFWVLVLSFISKRPTGAHAGRDLD